MIKLDKDKQDRFIRFFLGLFALTVSLLSFAYLLLISFGSIGFLGPMPEGKTTFIGDATIMILFMMFLMDVGWTLCVGGQAARNGLFSPASLWAIVIVLLAAALLVLMTGEPRGWWPALFAVSVSMFARRRSKKPGAGSQADGSDKN